MRTHRFQRRVLRAGIALLAAGLAGCGGSSGGGGAFTTAAPVSSGSTGAATSGTSSGGSGGGAVAPPQRQAPQNLHTGPELVLDTSGQGAFFDLPWPSDARRLPSGAPDLRGLPNPRGASWIDRTYQLAMTDTSGFSPSGTISFQFDAALAAAPADPLAFLAADAPVQLVDVDPRSPERGKRHPIHVGITARADSFRPAHLLQVLPVPGLALRPGTTYAALVLRKLGASGTPWLGQHPLLTELLAGQTPAGAKGPDLRRACEPLLSALPGLGIHPDDLAAATVFTTGDPTALLIQQARHLDGLAPLAPSALRTRDGYPDFTALIGTWQPPQFQQGTPPFVLGGGEQVRDASGLPVVQRIDTAELQLSVPKGRMPAGGFPLYLYVHGTGGLASQAIDRGAMPAPNVDPPLGSGLASYVAPVGWATACSAGPLSPGRIGALSADGYAAYNVFYPAAMRDNFVQMVLEMVLFRRLLLNLRIDPALCPGTDASAAPDGKIGFDPRFVVVGGQSLGSYLSGILAAVVPGWQGAVLTGAGGSWVEFAFGPKDPFDLSLVLQLLVVPAGETLDRFHPLVMAFDLAVGPADNMHYVRRLLRDPLPGAVPPHLLVVEGHADLQVPVGLQRALCLAAGVDLAGGDPAPGSDEQVAPVLPWGGGAVVPYPVSLNRTLPDGSRRTAVAVRYLPDFREGHYVSVQRPEPKRQIREFVQALGQGQAPTIHQ